MKKSFIFISVPLLASLMVIFAAASGSAEKQMGKGMGKDRGCQMQMKNRCGGCGFHELKKLEMMQKELGLSDEQVEKIFNIGTEYRDKYFKNRKDQDKIKELMTEHKKAVEAVLDEKQKEKFNSFHEKKKQRVRGKMKKTDD
ncbi:MAG: hypothetical protein MUD12_03810 [Spirochaetes bacterium]|jgi:Spy/CpxP family protein refolding chaperone|nr:hypothetical protein [Spirochaetota bacterium]